MRFRPDIEGLRAVAVALVVLAHAGVPGLGGGYLGADVFLVISGYLLTASMLRELDRTGRISLLGLFCRRARRLLPAASFVLVLVITAGYHWLGAERGDAIARDGIWAALFASNFHDVTSPLGHFWSLALLAQLSLVWPLAFLVLIWLGFRWALPYWLGAVVAGSFAYAVWQWSSFSPVTRAWEFGAGCLLALAAGRLDRIPYRLGAVLSVVGLALIVVAALTKTPFPAYASTLPVVATLLVLAGRGDSLLGVRPLQWLGRLAYPLYLWHWPVLAFGGPLTAVFGSLGLALVTYVCVENPIRRMTGPRSLTVAMAVVLIVLPIAVAMLRLSTSPVADARP